jgi:hypothetical protein
MNPLIPIRPRPRQIPLTTRFVLLFGNGFQHFGWIFFSIGMAISFAFAGGSDVASLWQFRGELKTTQGVVTGAQQTRFSVGGRKRSRGTPVFGYNYTFTVDQHDYSSVSYHTGNNTASDAKVTVQYPAGHPEISRIVGMRNSPLGPTGMLGLIVPVVGLSIILFGVKTGRKNLALLTNGEAAQGTLIRKDATNVGVNKQTVYKLTFAFTDLNGQEREAIAKTHLVEKLMDERTETLFYNPRNPKQSVMLDALPGQPSITAGGEIGMCRRGAIFSTLFFTSLGFLTAAVGLYFALSLKS